MFTKPVIPLLETSLGASKPVILALDAGIFQIFLPQTLRKIVGSRCDKGRNQSILARSRLNARRIPKNFIISATRNAISQVIEREIRRPVSVSELHLWNCKHLELVSRPFKGFWLPDEASNDNYSAASEFVLDKMQEIKYIDILKGNYFLAKLPPLPAKACKIAANSVGIAKNIDKTGENYGRKK